MIRFRYSMACAAIAAGIAVIVACARAAQSDDKPEAKSNEEDILKQVRTMARVIEDSLEHADIGRDRPMRLGGPGHVRGDYIPTVGAIFTVHVPFPIVDRSEEELAPAEESAKEMDLWERNARRLGRDRRGEEEFLFEIRDGLSDAMEDLHIELEAMRDEIRRDVGREMREVRRGFHGLGENVSDIVRESLREAEREVDRAYSEGEMTEEEHERAVEALERARDRAPRGPIPGLDEALVGIEPAIHAAVAAAPPHPPHVRLGPFPPEPPIPPMALEPYDAAKVDQLKNALIGAVAKYGHRMTELPDNERILLIVDAPAGAFLRRIERKEIIRRDGDGKAAEKRESEERREEKEEVKEEVKKEIKSQKRIIIRRHDPDVLFIRRGDRPFERDRLLLSINKADVKAEITGDALAPKVQERLY